MNVITKTVELPDGRTISIETGKLAKQADGAVMLRMNNTMLLATVCAAKDAVPGTDFMPLQVEYREKYYAAGRFPGGFTKREGKANDDEILTCRLVDRALRPLFPSNYHAEVYVNVILFSADGVDMPDALAGFAASAALAASDIPFEGPISEVRVARIDGQFVINPTWQQLEQADMDLMVGATEENIMMVEGEMKEVSEQDLLAALKTAHEAIKPMCRLQKELSKELGKDVKREYCHEVNDEELREAVKVACYQKAYDVTKQALEKHARAEAFEAIRENYKEEYAAAHADMTPEELEEKNGLIDRYYHDVERDAMRRCVLDEGIRLDGRKTTDIRPIWCEVSPLPGPHGSAIFTRGETQSLATCTLGTKTDEKLVDDVLVREYQRFLLHYNFPPFSTGEAKAQRGVGRREIGHGHLAWRGLKGQIPEDYPYVIRVVSDILESNGSSSMASTCAGCLALMDAGVPIKNAVSGIAMGLIKNPGEDKYAVLSDILGDEDHLGDMDFKTTGTVNGLTATQMDIKCDGLSYEILEKALMQAKAGREHILGEIVDSVHHVLQCTHALEHFWIDVARNERFELHNQVYGVDAVEVQVFVKTSFRDNLFRIQFKIFDEGFTDFIINLLFFHDSVLFVGRDVCGKSVNRSKMLTRFFVHRREGNTKVILDGDTEFKSVYAIESETATFLILAKQRGIVFDVRRCDVLKFKCLDQHLLNLYVQFRHTIFRPNKKM